MSGPSDTLDVLVIGAGQAGLAVGHHLSQQGARFLIIDAAGEVGASWRRRWDSLKLFTPAQYDNLPGLPFPAARDSYPDKDDVADYLHRYATASDLPVRLNTRVASLTRDTQNYWYLAEVGGEVLRARQVVVATGPFQVPSIPEIAAELDPGVAQLHSAEYRNPPGPAGRAGAGHRRRELRLPDRRRAVGDPRGVAVRRLSESGAAAATPGSRSVVVGQGCRSGPGDRGIPTRAAAHRP
jgi:cation diffusion facilitator CzcD-associated flavoprotein CzcO